jgi:hypothetical protein
MKVRTCITCKWIVKGVIFAKCVSPKATSSLDLVTGEYSSPFCQLLRLDGNQCGSEGKWWESF